MGKLDYNYQAGTVKPMPTGKKDDKGNEIYDLSHAEAGKATNKILSKEGNLINVNFNPDKANQMAQLELDVAEKLVSLGLLPKEEKIMFSLTGEEVLTIQKKLLKKAEGLTPANEQTEAKIILDTISTLENGVNKLAELNPASYVEMKAPLNKLTSMRFMGNIQPHIE